MRVNVYVDKPGAGSSNLILKFTYKFKTRLVYGLGILTKTEWFDNEKQLLTSKHPFHKLYNERITFIKSKAIEIQQKYLVNGNMNELTPEKFREELNQAQGIVKVEHDDFFTFFAKYIKKYNESTQKSYRYTLKQVKEFRDFYKKFDFQNINLAWLEDFQDWCFNVKDYHPNTANKHLTRIKKVLKEAYKIGAHNNKIFAVEEFTIKKVASESVYLSLSELAKIYKHPFSGHLERIRDIFIVACFSGQRISDWSKLKVSNMIFQDGQKYFNIITQKNKKVVSIPIHPIVETILKKYNYSPPIVADQHFNDEIKKVCDMAGINEMIMQTIYKNNKASLKAFKKYELIKSHTARRSFATNLYLLKVDILDIQTLLGHSKTETTLQYVKASSLERAKKISRHEFFQGSGFLKVV